MTQSLCAQDAASPMPVDDDDDDDDSDVSL